MTEDFDYGDNQVAPGSYTIHWRGAGDDGNVVSGTLRFTVAGK